MKKHILMVDDDHRVLNSLQLIVENQYQITVAKNGVQALEVILEQDIDLVLLDIALPGKLNGLQVLERLKQSKKNIPVIIISATDTANMAVDAMKLGAFHYLTKPIKTQEVLFYVTKALENQPQLPGKIRPFNSDPTETPDTVIIGNSSKLRHVLKLAQKVSQNDSTVYISGESGTGKELIAKSIHRQSPRKHKPFVAINCAAIPESLLEMEFFGYQKGSFTGAVNSKPGKLELAEGGTLFLDEIASLDLALQGKLLRVLQEREFERIGDLKVRKIDVRIISASNQDLKKNIDEKKFRADLYYRLHVFPIHLPPLRNRKEDIPLLVDHFIYKYKERYKKNIKGISADVVLYLQEYSWPGNVRELENL